MGMDLVGRRLFNQHITQPRLASPPELVRWMGAVQAQDYRGSLWALGLRLAGAKESDVEEAIAARTIVRTWPMRGTLHFVPAEDVRWMLRLLTPRQMARSAGRCRELGLDQATFTRSARILARALDGRALTRRDLYAALERGGVSTVGQRGIHVVGHLAQLGLICQGSRRERQPTFVLLDDWVRRPADPPREQALAVLAVRYFSSHGPASLEDFAWWSGLPLPAAREAIATAGSSLSKETWRGRTWWYAANERRSSKRTRDRAVLLPPWDEYLVAYRNHDAVLARLKKGPLDRLKTVGSSPVLIDGQVRGAWRRVVGTSGVRLTPEFWTPVRPGERRAVREAALRYAAFVDAALVS